MKKIYFILITLLLAFAGSSFAGMAGTAPIIVTNSATQTQVKAYAGLSWTLGGQKSSLQPDAIVGIRSLKVKSNDKVSNGLDISARFQFTDGVAYDSSRLSYVSGNRDLLTHVGFGYSSASKSFLATLAGQGAYSRVGVDYQLTNAKFLPYFDLLSVGKPKSVNPTTTDSCPAGSVLFSGLCYLVPS